MQCNAVHSSTISSWCAGNAVLSCLAVMHSLPFQRQEVRQNLCKQWGTTQAEGGISKAHLQQGAERLGDNHACADPNQLWCCWEQAQVCRHQHGCISPHPPLCRLFLLSQPPWQQTTSWHAWLGCHLRPMMQVLLECQSPVVAALPMLRSKALAVQQGQGLVLRPPQVVLCLLVTAPASGSRVVSSQH